MTWALRAQVFWSSSSGVDLSTEVREWLLDARRAGCILQSRKGSAWGEAASRLGSGCGDGPADWLAR